MLPAMHQVVVVLLCHLWWRSPVFPNNTKSQANQVLVSLPEIDGECDGVLPNASGSSGPFWPLGGVRVWPSVWILIPGFLWSRSLSLVAIDIKQWPWIETLDKFIQFGCKGPCKKIKKLWGCISHIWSMMSWRSIHPSPMDSFADMGTLPTWEKVLTSLIKQQDWQFKGWSWNAIAKTAKTRPLGSCNVFLIPPRGARNVTVLRDTGWI